MSTYKLAFIVGSLRQGSYNKTVAHAAAKLFPKEFQIEFIDISELPIYNQDKEGDSIASVEKFKQSILNAQGVVFFTPEHNRTIPAALKNALDTGSRPYGQSIWTGKPAMMAGVSSGAIGAALAQKDLRGVLAFLNMPTMAQPEMYIQYKEGMIDAQHQISNEGTKEFIQSWVNSCVA